MCDPTNGVFIFDALAVSVDNGPDVVALDPSLAVVPAVVPVASDAVDPVDAAVSVTDTAADSAFISADDDDPVLVMVPVPADPVAAAVAAKSLTPVTDAAEAELLILSAPLCVLSSAFAFAFGASEPPVSGNRPV